jgi:signal transduction histidine kinase
MSLGILMFSGVLFMGATALKSAEQTILALKMESLTQVTKSLQTVLGQWALDGYWDLERLPALMDRTAEGMKLDSFILVDGNGVIIGSTRQVGLGSRSSDPYLARALDRRRMISPHEVTGRIPDSAEGTWSFAAPVFIRGKMAGAFLASFPTQDLGVTLRLHRKIVYSFALLDALVILGFGIWLIGRVAIGPMVRISEGAKALAGGDYSSRVDVKGPKEIVQLAQSFNEMAARIEESAAQREDHLDALEKANLDLRSAQREMIRYEKLASVGELAAGVAHEIGNPLSAILGYASILLREEKDPEAVQYLEHIERETERIQRIISGLLDFSRPHETRIKPIDVNGLIESTVDLISPQKIFKEIVLERDMVPDLPVVRGDHYQLQQALINILLNGAQAMGGRGRMIVGTSTRLLDRDEGVAARRRASDRGDVDYAAMRRSGDQRSLSEGDRVVTVSIIDHGPGIPEEIAERVFDPFFTTKDPGEGTGLGLSITFGIIQAHGGMLRIRNREGSGAEILVDLPVFQEEQ